MCRLFLMDVLTRMHRGCNSSPNVMDESKYGGPKSSAHCKLRKHVRF